MGVAAADDGGGDGWLVEGPGDGDDAGLNAVAGTDLLEEIGEFQVAGELGFLELFAVEDVVVFWHGLDAFAGHGSGEQAALHGRVVDDADVVFLAEGKDFGFDVAVQHGVGRLQAGDGRDLRDALHLTDVEVRDAQIADLAFALEVDHGLPAFFDLAFRVGPVDLIEVDGINAEALEASFAPLADLLERVDDPAVFHPRSWNF